MFYAGSILLTVKPFVAYQRNNHPAGFIPGALLSTCFAALKREHLPIFKDYAITRDSIYSPGRVLMISYCNIIDIVERIFVPGINTGMED